MKERNANPNGQGTHRSTSEHSEDNQSTQDNLIPDSSINATSSPNPFPSRSARASKPRSPDPFLRRSARASKPRDLYCKTSMNQNEELVVELDQQRGLDQPGSFTPTEEDERLREERDKGKHLYYKILRKAKWTHKSNNPSLAPHRMESEWVFLAPGVTQETGAEGTNIFYQYADIWHKWSSDEAFRTTLLNAIDPNKRAQVEATAAGIANNPVGTRGEVLPAVDYRRLGVPTPGVPTAASRSVESNEEMAETAEEQGNPASKINHKRGRPNVASSKKLGTKRPKKKNGFPMRTSPPTPVPGGKIETPTPDANASNGLTRLNEPSVVTPTSISQEENQNYFGRESTGSNLQSMANAEAQGTIEELKKQLQVAQNLADALLEDIQCREHAHALRLAEANATITALQKQREESQNLADTRNIQMEYLTTENGKLLQGKAKETVEAKRWKDQCEGLQEEMEQMGKNHQQEVKNLKDRCEGLQEKMDQMRMNHAMEQGFNDS